MGVAPGPRGGPDAADDFDVVVAGAGIAGLSAAVEAAELGGRVLLLEKAPPEGRGGNTRFSDAQIRAPLGGDAYSPIGTSRDAFVEDWMRVTRGRANRELVEVLADRAAETLDWLTARGISWEPGFPHTATYRRKPAGGGGRWWTPCSPGPRGWGSRSATRAPPARCCRTSPAG